MSENDTTLESYFEPLLMGTLERKSSVSVLRCPEPSQAVFGKCVEASEVYWNTDGACVTGWSPDRDHRVVFFQVYRHITLRVLIIVSLYQVCK